MAETEDDNTPERQHVDEPAPISSEALLDDEASLEDAPPPRLPSLLEAPDGQGLRFDGKDFYELLGVSVEASVDDLRRAFKDQARAWHPDKAGPEFKDYFQLLSQAHDVLTDENTRRIYDSLLQYFPPPRPTFAEVQGTSFQNIEPFRASTANLMAVATFMHERLQWNPRALVDVSWNRISHDKRRVRVAFSANYALTRSADANPSLAFRSAVYDSVAEHLAHLLCVGGWRSCEESPETSSATECGAAVEETMPVVMLRHYLIGKMDEVDQPTFGIRFALEGTPIDLESLFVVAHRFAHGCTRDNSMAGCPIA